MTENENKLQRTIDVLETDVTRLKQTIDGLLELIADKDKYLTQLACLGNGHLPGNSIGNTIAQDALRLTPSDIAEVCANAGRYCFIKEHVNEIRNEYSVGDDGEVIWIYELLDSEFNNIVTGHEFQSIEEAIDHAMRMLNK